MDELSRPISIRVFVSDLEYIKKTGIPINQFVRTAVHHWVDINCEHNKLIKLRESGENCSHGE